MSLKILCVVTSNVEKKNRPTIFIWFWFLILLFEIKVISNELLELMFGIQFSEKAKNEQIQYNCLQHNIPKEFISSSKKQLLPTRSR